MVDINNESTTSNVNININGAAQHAIKCRCWRYNHEAKVDDRDLQCTGEKGKNAEG
jgi:hypothetical protein